MKKPLRPHYIQIGEEEVYFKAEFGNETHLRILALLERVRKTKILYVKKLKDGKGANALQKQLEDLRARSISLIKFSNKEDEKNQKQKEDAQESKESGEKESQAQDSESDFC